MKRIIILLALSLFFSIGTQAQQRGQRERMTPEQQAERMVKRLHAELKLTDKQQTELKTWFTDSFKKRNENFEKNRGNREAMQETMKKAQEETQAQLKKVLTADQYKKYQENEKKREKEMKERRERMGRRGGFGR